MNTNRKIYKKIIAIIFCFSLIFAIKEKIYADSEIQPSEFPDEKFYQYVLKNFDANGDGVLMESEAESVLHVEFVSDGITDITSIKGVECFKNVQFVNLGSNRGITDGSWLSGLTNITSVYINRTNITNIDFVKNMSKLTVFSAIDCPYVNDFTPLSQFNLEYLDINDNKQIKDISFVKDMTNLRTLNIAYNSGITDFSCLYNLTNMEYLNVDRTGVKSVGFLKNMNNLESFKARGCSGITDWNSISSCTKLKLIWIDECAINDLSFLKNMSNLESVEVSSNNISDITVLQKSYNTIDSIGIVENNITDISWIMEMPKLRSLEIRGNEIEILPDISSHQSLENINLKHNYLELSEAECKKLLPAVITSVNGWAETVGVTSQRTRDTAATTTEENSTGQDNTATTANTTEDRQEIISVPDSSIIVKGRFEKGAYLEGRKLTDTSTSLYQTITAMINSKLTNVIRNDIYDISIYKDVEENGLKKKVKIQPDGAAEVFIKTELADNVKYHVYRQEKDGSLTELNCYIKDENLCFYSDHFSIFTVVITKFFGEENSTEVTKETEERGETENITTTGRQQTESLDFKEQYTGEGKSSKYQYEEEEALMGEEKAKNSNSSKDCGIGLTGVVVVVMVIAFIGYYELRRKKVISTLVRLGEVEERGKADD